MHMPYEGMESTPYKMRSVAMGSHRRTSSAMQYITDMSIEHDHIHSPPSSHTPHTETPTGHSLFSLNTFSSHERSLHGLSPKDSESSNHIRDTANNPPNHMRHTTQPLQSTKLYLNSEQCHDYPESNRTVPLKLVNKGDNGICLIPFSSDDTDLIKSMCDLDGNCISVVICREPPIAQVPERMSEERPECSTNVADPPRTHPKHIYSTACDTFRVQLGKGSKSDPNGKFSRNARSESDAFWLCECALILIDCPGSLDEVVRNGNYNCMLLNGLVSSPEDFIVKLKSNADSLSKRGVLRPHEAEHLASMIPIYLRNVDIVDEEPMEESSHFSRSLQSQSMLQKASNSLAGWGIFLKEQTKNGFLKSEPKKRRRVSKISTRTKSTPSGDKPSSEKGGNSFIESSTQGKGKGMTQVQGFRRANTTDIYRQVSPDWKSLFLNKRSQSSGPAIQSQRYFFETPSSCNHVSDFSSSTFV